MFSDLRAGIGGVRDRNMALTRRMCLFVYIYIYIEREREMFMYMCVYLCVCRVFVDRLLDLHAPHIVC